MMGSVYPYNDIDLPDGSENACQRIEPNFQKCGLENMLKFVYSVLRMKK